MHKRTLLLLATLVPALLAACNSSAESANGEELSYASQRERMVEKISYMGVRDPKVLQVMRKVPRHLFVPKHLRLIAYRDSPLPIGKGQTISQPYIVAFMTEALELTPDDKVLEIGTGSGYQAAVLAELVSAVYSIEIVPSLGKHAAQVLKEQKYDNVNVRVGDGYRGWPEEAPFDAIIITAAPPRIPQPLVDQLKEGGRMILPLGSRSQDLILLTKEKGKVTSKNLLPVIFVPMTGEIETSP